MLNSVEKNIRPQPDKILVDIAEYALNYSVKSELALETAYYCLLDTLSCGFLALTYPACSKLLGPIVAGTVVPQGARVPGTSFELDPVLAAFNIGTMIRWLDFNDTWLAAEWGHPSDNLGAILAVADYCNRQLQKSFTVKTKLIVGSDGTNSNLSKFVNLIREKYTYQQTALTTTITLKRPHKFTAIELFTQEGPLALLPLGKKAVSLVWCMRHAKAEKLLNKDQAYILQALQTAIGYRLGRIVSAYPLQCYPLSQFFMPHVVQDEIVFIGNAAQTLHPVAAQGLNLGIRDVAMLAQTIIQNGLNPKYI